MYARARGEGGDLLSQFGDGNFRLDLRHLPAMHEQSHRGLRFSDSSITIRAHNRPSRGTRAG